MYLCNCNKGENLCHQCAAVWWSQSFWRSNLRPYNGTSRFVLYSSSSVLFSGTHKFLCSLKHHEWKEHETQTQQIQVCGLLRDIVTLQSDTNNGPDVNGLECLGCKSLGSKCLGCQCFGCECLWCTCFGLMSWAWICFGLWDANDVLDSGMWMSWTECLGCECHGCEWIGCKRCCLLLNIAGS